MGAIVAVMHKEKQKTSKTVFTMLNELSHRGKNKYAIASTKEQTLANSLEKLKLETVQSNIVLGDVFSKILPSDTPQILTTDNCTLVFEGRIYPSSKITDTASLVEKLKSNPAQTAKTIIKNYNGDYTFAIATSDSIIIGRDSMGVVPLYFGRNKTLCAFASERKALWKIGLRKVKSFPPGNIAVVRKDARILFELVRTIEQPPLKPLEMDSATKRIQMLLLQSIRDRVSDMREVAVAFSGGLDSSLIAFLTQKCRVKIQLITVGLETMPETVYAEDAAKALDMPIHVKTYSGGDVEKVLPKVLWLVEEPDFLKVSIAIPLYWTAEFAATHGLNVLLAGQGADELFGGYRRYSNDYVRYGEEFVQKTIFNDIVKMHENNFERDSKICNFHNTELRLPFATYQMAKFAATLPLPLKIEPPNDLLRKTVLRKVAEDIGLPRFIVNKPKRAIQYATGVNKVIKKLAKKKGYSTKEYLQEMFQTIFKGIIT